MMELSALFVVVTSMLSIGGSIGPMVRKYELCESHKAVSSDNERRIGGGGGGGGSGTGYPSRISSLPHMSGLSRRHAGDVEAPSYSLSRPTWDVDPAGFAVDVNPDGMGGEPSLSRRRKRNFWTALQDLVVSALTVPASPPTRRGRDVAPGAPPPTRASPRGAEEEVHTLLPVPVPLPSPQEGVEDSRRTSPVGRYDAGSTLDDDGDSIDSEEDLATWDNMDSKYFTPFFTNEPQAPLSPVSQHSDNH